MNKQIRTSKFSKVVASYLSLMMFLQIVQPMAMYALTSGPKQPEFTAFTPISTSDMVSLTSGDFNYNIPIMDVGGYPLNLAYDSGVTMDQEASWVGLGWNLNVGQISRQVRGLPDDFQGDVMNYKNNMKDNITVGTNFNVSPALLGNDTPFSLGLGVEYNNYNGITFKPSIGLSYSLAGIGQVGVDLSSSIDEGATLNPSVGLSTKLGENTKGSLSLSAGLNSRKGLENMGMSVSATTKCVTKTNEKVKDEVTGQEGFKHEYKEGSQSLGSVGSSLSFNSQSYTPTKRIGYDNVNKTFNATIGGEVFGLEGQVRISGYGSVQSINDDYKNKNIPAFGYENTQFKNNSEGVLDFNREKEQVINKNTNALPITNYTYDIYNIEGQGVAGMFRPFRSQVGYLYNDDVADFSSSNSFGVELGLGNLVHGGINFTDSPTNSKTGLWRDYNNALPAFAESNTDVNDKRYETVTFKLVGEMDADNNADYLMYKDRIKESSPLRIKLDDDAINPSATRNYLFKPHVSTGSVSYGSNQVSLSQKIKRSGRLLRNQTIQKFTAKDTDEKFIFRNTFAKDHHTAGMKVLQSDGTMYVFGKSVYNTEKIEATFDVSGRSQVGDDAQNGLISYNGALGGNNNGWSDKFENKITTPGYAHTFLITSVLSSDYEDISDNGPTDDDLGGYTKFRYTENQDRNYISNYQWRVPFERNKASYNEGLKSSEKDQKGNYIYGKKELTYLKIIETKTHVAFIDLEDRKDAMSVVSENGDMGNQSMKFIKAIRLYSKPELQAANISIDDAYANIPTSVLPIKTAHFEYTYDLCKGIPSSSNLSGKLTLKKVYFTYRGSDMGKFTPYVFNYDETNLENNANYSIKGFDIWGNYKQNNTSLPNTDYPFVQQDQVTADKNTGMWVLKSIQLPSGGTISIRTESDDYQYVQDRKAMQMFKVVGAGDQLDGSSITDDHLFSGSNHKKYIYVQIPDASLTHDEFINRYLSENLNKPIYFKFLLKMHGSNKDYVSGYFEIDPERMSDIQVNNGKATIPLKFLRMDGGFAGDNDVNPIAKAGWGFGRTNLNRLVYSGNEVAGDFVSIVKGLVSSIATMSEIFTGPNYALQIRGCANTFDNQRSWVRLENPNGIKLGGGLRVNKIELSDDWDVMNAITDPTMKPIYEEMYGQEYSYEDANGRSSGVASFEPNASPENPFVEPFYGKDDQNYAERIGAPRESNYVEKPFGENFFPSPKITYSKVTVSNLNKNIDNGPQIKKHATGKVVTEHYTSRDFPTIVDFTNLDLRPYEYKSPLLQMLSVNSTSHLTGSQGFTIETNDMDGKVKSQKVYAEGQDGAPISSVEYKYNVGSDGRLDNKFTTINPDGEIEENLLGVNYDVINDFNESSSNSESIGFDGNLASFLIGFFPLFVPIVLPREAHHETILRTATTTKVIHKRGVLKETIAYDLGSRVSTKNLAWDARTGQTLLTQTINEFDDKYYSFNYPAYWYYDNMGMASENIDIKGKLVENGGFYHIEGVAGTLKNYFKIGDELAMNNNMSQSQRLWIVDFNGTNNQNVKLMNSAGEIVDASNQPTNLNFRIIRSGNRNQQMASMASVTLMKNPLINNTGGIRHNITEQGAFEYDNVEENGSSKIINASAIEYGDDWKSQCENGLPSEEGLINAEPGTPVNPYKYNIKGDWRAIKSYAYLTGRNNFLTTNRRKAGYFKDYKPFYKKQTVTSNWEIDSLKWTFASRVTMYNPYGIELENKDALNRYSSAQYGYKYTLPIAVSSNAHYREIGFDGFEDYDPQDIINETPSNLKPHFGFSQDVYIDKNAFITSKRSHTGNKSVAVKSGKSVRFIRKVDGCISNQEEEKQKIIVKPTSKKNN